MQAIASLKICNLIGFILSNAYKVLDEKVQRGMSHDTSERPKEKLILEKYAFFV